MPELKSARTELEKAKEARAIGNEGQARVLCRLAAAEAIRSHLAVGGNAIPAGSAYDLLAQYAAENSFPAAQSEALAHLCMRVDADYNLPQNIDLIKDAELIIRFYESDESSSVSGVI